MKRIIENFDGFNIRNKAEELFDENISKEFIRTDMGSGWQLRLFSPLRKDYVEKFKYLDMYDDMDGEITYDEWKVDMLEYSLEDFKSKFLAKHIDDFIEYLQPDED